MFKHFKTKIMAFKLTNNLKGCTINIMSNNLKGKIKGEGVFSLSSTLSSKFEEYFE
jgi:hypothetical protein